MQILESELVAGFFTEHSAMPFVFFFLAEYCSIVLMSALTAILFLGGYMNYVNLLPLFEYFGSYFGYFNTIDLSFMGPISSILSLQSIVLAIKTSLFCFLFVWFRATLPRLRYDQLMTLCWTGVLPVVIAYIILVPSLLIAFDISPFVA